MDGCKPSGMIREGWGFDGFLRLAMIALSRSISAFFSSSNLLFSSLTTFNSSFCFAFSRCREAIIVSFLSHLSHSFPLPGSSFHCINHRCSIDDATLPAIDPTDTSDAADGRFNGCFGIAENERDGGSGWCGMGKTLSSRERMSS